MSWPPVLTSRLLEAEGIRHAFFTRAGGVSSRIYGTLNVGLGSDDDPRAVRENRRRCAAHFDAETIVTVYQVHSATALAVDGPWPGEPPRADGVVTATPGVVCGALAADCAPILLADAQGRVVAAAHAGWKGALGGIVEATVEQMVAQGARRGRLHAAIGPCIGPRSYEVGLEFLERFVEANPAYEGFFGPGASAEKRMFDLPAFVLGRLAAAGVGLCEWVGRDTCAEPDQFFSNRRALLRGQPDFGRLMSAIALT
ncbi:peptidoglycan editing factor PgeF [Phenylobacterium sp.]|uniref:peptidoglycan editing factor PgeF n=1 Tax=Phenylobacterium sp. TaxID=1871053 RepID=UPI003569B922